MRPSQGRKDTLESPWVRSYENRFPRELSLTKSSRPYRHSREGGNPRTNAPRQNGHRETRNHNPSRHWHENSTGTISRQVRKSCRTVIWPLLDLGKCSGGACPPPKALRQPVLGQRPSVEVRSMASLNSKTQHPQFSYLRVPAAAAISDWYENERYPLNLPGLSFRTLNSSFRPPNSSFRPLNSSFRRKPESRGVEGVGKPGSAGVCSQPRIRHSASFILLRGRANAIDDSGMWCLPCL